MSAGGWQDDRLEEAFDLITAVKRDHPSDRHVKAACNDTLDNIELIDGEIRESRPSSIAKAQGLSTPLDTGRGE